MDFKDYRGMDKEYSGIVKNEEKYTIFHGCMLLILINMNLLTQIRSHARGGKHFKTVSCSFKMRLKSDLCGYFIHVTSVHIA